MAATKKAKKKDSSRPAAKKPAHGAKTTPLILTVQADFLQFEATLAQVFARAEERARQAAVNIAAELERTFGAKAARPTTAIGTNWPDALGGIYAGIVRGVNGQPDQHLIVMTEAPKRLTWQQAMKWAEDQEISLPTRREQAVLFGNVPELFEQAWYWSCEQFAGTESSAWCQHFNGGTQYGYRKYDELRARAVRRLPI